MNNFMAVLFSISSRASTHFPVKWSADNGDHGNCSCGGHHSLGLGECGPVIQELSISQTIGVLRSNQFCLILFLDLPNIASCTKYHQK